MAKDNIFKLIVQTRLLEGKNKKNLNQGPNNLSEIYVFVYLKEPVH